MKTEIQDNEVCNEVGLWDEEIGKHEAVPHSAETEQDIQLMERIVRKDDHALQELYERYRTVLRSTIERVIHNAATTDDVVQEVLLQVWNRADKYSPEKGSPLNWLLTISRRRAIDRLRRRETYHRLKQRVQDEATATNAHDRHEDREVILADLRHFLDERIAVLPPAQRRVTELAFFQGMSQRKISEVTRAPLGTVKTRIELAFRKLSREFKGFSDKV